MSISDLSGLQHNNSPMKIAQQPELLYSLPDSLARHQFTETQFVLRELEGKPAKERIKYLRELVQQESDKASFQMLLVRSRQSTLQDLEDLCVSPYMEVIGELLTHPNISTEVIDHISGRLLATNRVIINQKPTSISPFPGRGLLSQIAIYNCWLTILFLEQVGPKTLDQIFTGLVMGESSPIKDPYTDKIFDAMVQVVNNPATSIATLLRVEEKYLAGDNAEELGRNATRLAHALSNNSKFLQHKLKSLDYPTSISSDWFREIYWPGLAGDYTLLPPF